MYNILAVISILLSCYFLLRVLKPPGIAEGILILFCLFTSHIAAIGYTLSAMNQLSDVRYWTLFGFLAALASALILRWKEQSISFPGLNFDLISRTFVSLGNQYKKNLSTFEKLILTPLFITVSTIGILNLIVIVFAAPHNWDSMTYHLVRMAYYLQHNNLDSFGANYWAQVVHPKNSALMLLFTYLVTGRNENLTQLVQFISYWAAACSVYAISRKSGNSRKQSLFAALVSGLLIDWLMQATTTQNDLMLTAYFGAIVYFLFAFREKLESKYLVLAALGTGLAIGTKASAFLPMVSLVFILLYILIQNRKRIKYPPRDIIVLIVSSLFIISLFTFPAGYLENYFNYGNPIGPRDVREHHSFEGESTSFIVRNGSKNLLRFGFEFLSMDGMFPFEVVEKAQNRLQALPEKVVQRAGIELEIEEGTLMPYKVRRMPLAHEDRSYWGILGFGLIWIAVFLSLLGIMKPADTRVLSCAVILFLLSQAYAGPFDPFRGRYFTGAAIFAVPAVGVFLSAKNPILRAYIFMIIILGCFSAVSAVILRNNSTLVSIQYKGDNITSIFGMNRLEQLTRNRTKYYAPLAAFDQIVPQDAIVAVYLKGNQFEYPLFGKRLTRTILPINSFDRGLQPIPMNAEYLLYMVEGFPCVDVQNDIPLGADWYLRELTDKNRNCP